LYYGFKTIVLDFPLSMILAVLALADAKSWRPMRDLVIASILTLFGRLILFPDMEERYYTWFLLVAMVGAIASLSGRWADQDSWLVRRPERGAGRSLVEVTAPGR